MNETRGTKTSERKACYHAFYAAVLLAAGGIYTKADLGGLAALVAAVGSPLMWYAGNRTYLKSKTGGEEKLP